MPRLCLAFESFTTAPKNGIRELMDGVARVSIAVATLVSMARTGWVVLGLVRTLGRGGNAADVRWNWVMLLMAPEVVLPAIAALWLSAGADASPPDSTVRQGLALLGAILSLGGLALTMWSWWSLPSAGTGHYLLTGQALVVRGPYAFVRHPIYSGAFLIWFGLAAAYASLAVLLLTMGYVIPAYCIDIQSEETMLISRYGDEYRDYQRRVGAFLPRR